MGIPDENGKWKKLLLCCFGSVVPTLSNAITLNRDVTKWKVFWNRKKRNFRRSNRNEKLRSVAYRKGISRNVFIHELKTCIKELSFFSFMGFWFSRKFRGVFRKNLKIK